MVNNHTNRILQVDVFRGGDIVGVLWWPRQSSNVIGFWFVVIVVIIIVSCFLFCFLVIHNYCCFNDRYADKYRQGNDKPDSWQALIEHIEALQSEVRSFCLISSLSCFLIWIDIANKQNNSLWVRFDRCCTTRCLTTVPINGRVRVRCSRSPSCCQVTLLALVSHVFVLTLICVFLCLLWNVNVTGALDGYSERLIAQQVWSILHCFNSYLFTLFH